MGWFADPRPGRFVKVYIANLRGICLEWAVAAVEGRTSISDYTSLQPRLTVDEMEGDVWLTLRRQPDTRIVEWTPLTNWLQLGELIDKYDMSVATTTRSHPDMQWFARGYKPGGDLHTEYGPSRYVAILRTVVLINSESNVIEVPLDLAEMSGTGITDDQLARVLDSDVGEIIDLRKSQN